MHAVEQQHLLIRVINCLNNFVGLQVMFTVYYIPTVWKPLIIRVWGDVGSSVLLFIVFRECYTPEMPANVNQDRVIFNKHVSFYLKSITCCPCKAKSENIRQ